MHSLETLLIQFMLNLRGIQESQMVKLSKQLKYELECAREIIFPI